MVQRGGGGVIYEYFVVFQLLKVLSQTFLRTLSYPSYPFVIFMNDIPINSSVLVGSLSATFKGDKGLYIYFRGQALCMLFNPVDYVRARGHNKLMLSFCTIQLIFLQERFIVA